MWGKQHLQTRQSRTATFRLLALLIRPIPEMETNGERFICLPYISLPRWFPSNTHTNMHKQQSRLAPRHFQMPWHGGSLSADCFHRAHFYPCAKRRLKRAMAEKHRVLLEHHLLPVSTHVLAPRDWWQELLPAALREHQRLHGDACLLALRCCKASAACPGKQGKLCSRLTAAVTSSRDVAPRRKGFREIKGLGSCWGQAEEPPAAAAWDSQCPPALRQERCPGCGGRVSHPSASPASGRPPGKQGAALAPPESSTSLQRPHVWEIKQPPCGLN